MARIELEIDINYIVSVINKLNEIKIDYVLIQIYGGLCTLNVLIKDEKEMDYIKHIVLFYGFNYEIIYNNLKQNFNK